MTIDPPKVQHPTATAQPVRAEPRRFDWYAATLAAGITGPFASWALYVLLAPRYLAIALGALAFMTFVFLGFGRLRLR